jgi:hypothetical protein
MAMMILGILCLDGRPIVTVLHASFHGEFLEAEENSEGQWSGLSESNGHLNLGKLRANGASETYKALSGAFSSV